MEKPFNSVEQAQAIIDKVSELHDLSNPLPLVAITYYQRRTQPSLGLTSHFWSKRVYYLSLVSFTAKSKAFKEHDCLQ